MVEKKWFRFLLNAVIGIALVVGLVVFAERYEFSTDFQWDACIIFGLIAYIGTFFFFLATDILYDADKTIIGILRLVVTIIGMLFIGFGGMLSMLSVAFDATKEVVSSESPWLFALATPWMMSGILSFLLYCFAEGYDWHRVFFPIIPILSFLGSYILCVIFTYIGNAAGSFFYGWLPFILSIGGIVWVVFELKENGLPFDILSSKHTIIPSFQTTPTKSSNKNQSSSDEKLNAKIKNSEQLKPFINELEWQIRKKIINDKQSYLPLMTRGNYKWLNGLYVNYNCYTIRIEGQVGCKPFSNDVDDAEDTASSVAKDIVNKIKNRAEAIQSSVRRDAKARGIDVSSSELTASIEVVISYSFI